MFDFIITALGGFTKREHDLNDKLIESWRVRATAAETTVELMKEILQRERERSERLMENFKPRNQDQAKPPEMNPVGDRRLSSWPRIKRELERQNRDAQISRTETQETVRSKVGDSVRNHE